MKVETTVESTVDLLLNTCAWLPAVVLSHILPSSGEMVKLQQQGPSCQFFVFLPHVPLLILGINLLHNIELI